MKLVQLVFPTQEMLIAFLFKECVSQTTFFKKGLTLHGRFNDEQIFSAGSEFLATVKLVPLSIRSSFFQEQPERMVTLFHQLLDPVSVPEYRG